MNTSYYTYFAFSVLQIQQRHSWHYLLGDRFALCYRTLVLSVCLSFLSCPVCDVGALWPNGWTDQDETWHAGRRRPRPLCVRRGPSLSLKRGTAPTFRPMFILVKRLDGSRCHLVRR